MAPRAKKYGNMKIANNIALCPNVVAGKSFEDDFIIIAGNPFKKLNKFMTKKKNKTYMIKKTVWLS